MSRSRLQKLVADVCSEIREISPETKVVVSYEPFEDVDATIHVYPPDEDIGERIDEAIHQTTFNILLDEGYFISVLVYEPDGASEGVREED